MDLSRCLLSFELVFGRGSRLTHQLLEHFRSTYPAAPRLSHTLRRSCSGMINSGPLPHTSLSEYAHQPAKSCDWVRRGGGGGGGAPPWCQAWGARVSDFCEWGACRPRTQCYATMPPTEAEWRLCALEIEDEVPLSPREPQSAVSTPLVAIFFLEPV